MATHHAETIIGVHPGQVFPFLVEPDRLKQWMSGLVDSKALTEGGPRVGARSQETVEEDGRRVVVLTEITQYEVNRTLAVKLENDMFDAVSCYDLEVHAAGTHVKHRFEAKYKGMMRFMAVMIGGMVQKKLEGDMQRLKQAAERGG